MSLTDRTKNALVDKINMSFAGIGTANGTKMPKSGNNREATAWEMWLSHQLATLANKRKSVAEAASVKEGVIFDKDKHPMRPGTKEVLFRGELVTISVEVRKPATRVDVDKLLAFLVSKKVPQTVLTQAIEAAQVENKPAHIFTPILFTSEA